MTQQPYGQPGYPAQPYPQQYPPQIPQQGYPAQPQQPYAPPAQYAPPAPMGYPAPQGQPQPATPPVQSGSIDDYYNQPVAAGGPGISWKDKPLGTTYVGVIASNPTVQQDSDYTTKLPKFQRDGVTPQWVMLIPLERVQSNFAHPNGQPEFPTGEVVFYARGKDKEEIARAMAEAGCSGAPQAGATFQVTLVERKPQRQGNPKNVVRIAYTPAGTEQRIGSASPAAEQAPAPQAVPQAAPQAPAPQPVAQQAPQQFQQPQFAPATPYAQAPQPEQQAPAPQPVAQQPQAVPSQQPVAPAPGPQPPAGMPPEQAAILQSVIGGAAGQAQG